MATQLELATAHTTTNSVMRHIDSALRQLRELFHSHGRISSRNEALDEVAILLFAHAMGVQGDGAGISAEILNEQSGHDPVEKLRRYVGNVISDRMPKSLEHEFNSEDFKLHLKSGENDLAVRIVAIFDDLPLGSQGDPLRVDIINEAFGRFLADSFIDEKELGQYLTPPEVVDFMVRLAVAHLTEQEIDALVSSNPAQGYGYVLDPSCGVGSFLAEFIRVVHENTVLPSGKVSADWPAIAARDLMVGIDKSERMIRLALANLALFGAPAARLHLANSLAMTGPNADALRFLVGKAGLILTNPPFGATFSNAETADYQIANNWAARRPAAVDSELLFMERYLTWLRPGGQLLAIVPDSILTNKALFADLRRGISSSINILDVVSLPAVTFAAAGTTTKTSVLHLRREQVGSGAKSRTRFAVCTDLGYSVSSRGSQRTKIPHGKNELITLLSALTAEEIAPPIREVEGVAAQTRWDATYHASMSAAVEERLAGQGTRVGDVAILSNERIDPRRSGSPTFRYIEISDVNGATCSVTHKVVPTGETPSRARQLVHQGDVLVSTVRPERRSVGVVPPWLDGAVCTTGFAVLRPQKINGLLLATLLRTEFVTQQLLRNNIGIAYPAIEPNCLHNVLLPLDIGEAERLNELAESQLGVRAQLHQAQQAFGEEVSNRTAAWLRQIPDGLEI